ncbi:hypothetical protein ATZ33_13065 [Enterococcus silesiacus]|uniref:Uncharacterized protein n=1 Tax=Enterococcus silesiacus TaxID=332949 RepID=A0A0S3KDZ2_9ENTE|nr:tetratricopeptide repeat protein [Enterococcus silesiacus]ALS02281.1 hypothetical protein ATZ33_13065 [Enterococcus silesiacus]OJG92356.1 hypothetical protein RV15_GL003149 [Enterococcus silesiacus]
MDLNNIENKEERNKELSESTSDDVLRYYNLGNALEKQKKYQEAGEAYRKAIELNPTHATTYYNLGCVLEEQGKYEEAVEAYQKAIELNPDYASAYYKLGNILDKQGKYEEAVEAYKKAIESNPDHASTYYKLGNRLYKQGKYEEVVQAYKKAIELNPNYTSAYNNLGIALDKQGKYEEAVEVYQKVMELNPNNATIYYNLGNTLYKQKKYDQAIKVYQKAIELNPNYASAYNNLGNALDKQEKYEGAVEAYQKAIDLKKSNTMYYNNLGNTLYRKKEYDKAIEVFKEVIELNPANASAYNKVGLILTKQEKHNQAIKYYQKAIKLDPKNIKYNNNLASAFEITKNYSGALTDLLQKIGIEQVSYDTMIKIIENNKEYELDYEEIINSMTNYNNNFLQKLIKETTSSMTDTQSIFKAIIKIIININYFKSSLLLKDDVVLYQYTSINTLSSLLKLQEDTKDTNINIRLYNTEYMNDPEEGKFLSNLLRMKLEEKNEHCEETISKLIHNICDVRNDVSHAFISSLTKNKDDIPMWKMYGDDNKGISLGFKQLPISEDESLYGQEENNNIEDDEYFDDKNYQFIETSPLTYKIQYLKNDDDLATKEDLQIKLLVDNIFYVISKIHGQETISTTFNTFLSIELDKIKFLVKNKKYNYENEYRLLQMTKDFTHAKHDPNNPKLFLEVNTISLEKVIFGVNFENYYNWVPFILKKAPELNFSDVKKSEIPLR